MNWVSEVRSLPTIRKALLAAGAALVLFALFGYFALPAILKPILQNALTDALHRKTVVREVRVNPFLLTVTVRGLEISEREAPGKWISAGEIYGDLEAASVFRGGPVLREILVKEPYVNIVRRPDGSYNFSDILEEAAKKPKKESKPLKFSLNNIQVVDGRVDFLDGPKGVRHKVEGIQIAVPFVSNLRHSVDKYIQPWFSAVVNGDAVWLKGKTKPFKESLETDFDIDIIGLSLPKYLEYVPFRREYDVPSALLDAKAVLSFLQRGDGRPVIRVDGYAELRDVRVIGKDKSPMIFLPSVRAVLSPADMGAGEYRLASLAIRNPEIDVVIDRNKKLNLMALTITKSMDNVDAKIEEPPPAPGGGKATGAVFSIDSLRLSGGRVRFSDLSRKTTFRTALGDIRVDVDGFSTEKGKSARAEASLSTESGETAGMKGTFSVEPAGSEGTFSIKKLAPAKYALYYSDQVLFDVNGGTLDLDSGYSFARSPDGTRFRLQGLALSVDGLRLRQREEKEDFLEVPSFRVKDAQVDPERRELTVGEISTEKGRVGIRRLAGGGINVSRLVPQGGTAGAEGAKPEGANPEGQKPWTVTLKKVSVDRYNVRFDDGTTAPPVELAFDGMRLRVEDLTTAKNRKGTFSFATVYNRTGKFSLDGTLSVDPPSVAGRLRARNLPIGALHPYFSEDMRIVVTSGSMSAEGTIRVSVPKGAPLQASYKGEADVNGFSSIDKEQGEEFLSFQSLHFGGMDIAYPPANAQMEEIALSDFYSRIILYEDASLNVQGVVGKGVAKDNTAARGGGAARPAKEEKAEAKAKGEAGSATIRIAALTLQGGRVNFSDRYIKPNYTATLVGIGGRVSGLSSEENQRADVDLKGNLGRGAPLEIKGKINPLAKELFLDLNVGFKEIDLSPLTPYSGRYAGYGIEKGQLTLNLSYHIEKRKLEAQNKVFLNQFTFGDPVDSPEATKLPVKLAVSLLKDRNGEIHLDLPVTGDLDDPKFSIWGILWQIVRNLLVKAATAPFALIGSLFGGGGEQLSYLEFEPGSSEIPPAGEEKIRNLSKALYDRPALRLEVVGHADPANDPEALRQAIFRHKVAAQKVKALAEAGKPAPPLDNVTFLPGEYEKYLKQAYKEEKFPKPRNFIGMAKDLPVPEMEKLMLTNIQVAEGDLRQLAVDRAARVRDALVSGGRVEPGRVFLVEPKTVAPEKKDKLKDSRVDFAIK